MHETPVKTLPFHLVTSQTIQTSDVYLNKIHAPSLFYGLDSLS